MVEVFTIPTRTSGHGKPRANSDPESRSWVARKSKEVDVNRSAHGIKAQQSGSLYLDASIWEIEARVHWRVSC